AAAANADAGADAVDLAVDAGDGHLRPIAGLPCDGPDADGAVVDLRDLLLEQAAHEGGVGPRQGDLDAVSGPFDVQHDRLDAFADVVRLAGNRLAARHEGLGLGQGHGAVAALVALHGAVDHVALLLGVRVVDGVALVLLEALDEELLGGGGG